MTVDPQVIDPLRTRERRRYCRAKWVLCARPDTPKRECRTFAVSKSPSRDSRRCISARRRSATRREKRQTCYSSLSSVPYLRANVHDIRSFYTFANWNVWPASLCAEWCKRAKNRRWSVELKPEGLKNLLDRHKK